MTVWILGGLLSVAVLAGLLVPIYRHRGHASSTAYEIAVYEDQLTEVTRDEERGVVSAEQARAMRQEIERRLGKTKEAAADDVRLTSPAFRLVTTVVVAIAVPALSGWMYWSLGEPTFPDQPFAERAKAPPSDDPRVAEMTKVVAQLAQRMESNPDRTDGWMLLGRSFMTLERHLEAARAFARARSLEPGRADIAVALGEATVMAQQGILSDDAIRLFTEAMDADPQAVRPHYFLGLAAAQRNAFGEAVQRWTDMIALSPDDAPWLPEVRQRLAAAAKAGGIDLANIQPRTSRPAGPTVDDVRAAQEMSAADRAEMIRGMVEGLAERLNETPDDLEGWKRLARAYRVLGEVDKAKEAEARVRLLEAN